MSASSDDPPGEPENKATHPRGLEREIGAMLREEVEKGRASLENTDDLGIGAVMGVIRTQNKALIRLAREIDNLAQRAE